MQHCAIRAAVAAAAWLLVSASGAGAQSVDATGTRAQGLGGAFVGLADDASAVWWNPAGVAGGPYFNAIVEVGRLDRPPSAPPGGPADRTTVSGFAAAYPALGISYLRVRLSEMAPTAGLPGSRQDQGVVYVRLQTLGLQQFGVTVGQSIGDHLVIASTLKLLNGHPGFGVGTVPASLDQAAALDSGGDTTGDLDVGALVRAGRVRAGVAVRNLREPTFGSGTDAITLRRQARAGVAVESGAWGPVTAFAFDVDADLTTRSTVFGDRRDVAAGAEAWFASRRVGVRGGVEGSTIGDARVGAAAGVSLAFRRGAYLDAAYLGATRERRAGWSFGLRVTF